MRDLLKNTYDNIESLSGKKLLNTLLAVFITFLIVGLSVGYFINVGLKQNEPADITDNNQLKKQTKVEFSGYVQFVDEAFRTDPQVEYKLVDSKGGDITPLMAKDEKLTIVEGLYVKVTGKKSKTKLGNDVLMVEEVLISNATD